MKLRMTIGAVMIAFAIGALFSSSVNAQAPLLVEDFNYDAGALLTANGWTAHSGGGTNPIAVTSPGLTLTGYPSSGVGNAVSLTTSGEDDNRVFPVQSAGTVYAAFMVNVSEASTDALGGYFFHLGPDPVSTTFRGRVFVKKDGSNNLAFGLSKALTTAGNIAFTGFDYSLNTTYLVIVKYSILDGATNDTVELFVSTITPGTEPMPTLIATDTTQSDVNPGTVSLRQGSTATAPTLRADGIRVGTTWASVTQVQTPTQHIVDFNGDGKTDYALVRNVGGGPSGQIRWFINYTGTATTVASDWGLAGDVFVPADYDGDNNSDIAVWRGISNNQPSGNAFFYILQSQTNTVRIDDFGVTGDNPAVVGDYNGDGKDDVAVYRAGASPGQNSTWYWRTTAGGPISNQIWGLNGDFPAPGDYDGDGKNDFVTQRNNGGGTAIFWLNQTTAGISNRVFGTPTDVIVPGDYDGDGKTDLAIVRASGGALNWWHLRSSDGNSVQTVFGASATDFPTVGDYDGDGKSDQAIWRPSATAGASAFWVNGSTSGAFSQPMGSNGDYPVANTFRF